MHNFPQLLLDCLVHRRDGGEANKIKKKTRGKKNGRSSDKYLRMIKGKEIQRMGKMNDWDQEEEE